MNEFLPLDRRLLIISETIRSIERFFVHWKDSVINEDDLSSITYLYFNKAVETKSHYEFTLLMWYTGSAAEDFAMPFKYNNRGTIVGQHTYGSTGQPAYINLGENIHLGIGSIRAFFPNGDEFEGIGIEPDIKISLSRQDIYNGRDPVFEKALELV